MEKILKTLFRIVINFILIYFISVGFIVSYVFQSGFDTVWFDTFLIFLIIGIIEFWRNPKK